MKICRYFYYTTKNFGEITKKIDNFALLLRYKLNLSVNIIKKFLTIWVKLCLTTDNISTG